MARCCARSAAARALPVRHGALYRPAAARLLAPCYHCSRYNLNTGRLTPAMFTEVFGRIRALVDQL